MALTATGPRASADLLAERDRLAARLLLLHFRRAQLQRDESDALPLAWAILDLEDWALAAGARTHGGLYGIPTWLAQGLRRLIDDLRSGSAELDKVAELLGVHASGPEVSERLVRLDDLSVLATAASTRPTPSTAELITERAAGGQHWVDVPVTYEGRGLIARLRLEFRRGDPTDPHAGFLGGSDRAAAHSGFIAGVRRGLTAAQELLRELHVEHGRAALFADLEVELRGIPAEVPVTGGSAALPVALHVLARVLELAPPALAATGELTVNGGVVELPSEIARAKAEAVRADGVSTRMTCNAPSVPDRVTTLEQAAVLAWPHWTDHVARPLIQRELERECDGWSAPDPVTLATHLDAEPLIGDTGEENGLAEELEGRHPGVHVVRGPPRSGRTFLVARVASRLDGWHVVWLRPRDERLPDELQRVCRSVRHACRPGARVLIVFDAVELEPDDVLRLLELRGESSDTSVVVVCGSSAHVPPRSGLSVFDLNRGSAAAVAQTILAAHPELHPAIKPSRLDAMIARARGDLGLLVELVADAANPQDAGSDDDPRQAMLAKKLDGLPRPGVLMLASCSSVGVATPPSYLAGIPEARLRALGAVRIGDDGWRVPSPEAALELVRVLDDRGRRRGKRSRMVSPRVDALVVRITDAVSRGEERAVVALMAGAARHDTEVYETLVRKVDLVAWARTANVPPLRSLLMVVRTAVHADDASQLAHLLGDKLALQVGDLTVRQTALTLRLLMEEFPELLHGDDGESLRTRLTVSLSRALPDVLPSGGPASRMLLLDQVWRLDRAHELVARHGAAFAGALRAWVPDDFRLARRVLQRLRGASKPARLAAANAAWRLLEAEADPPASALTAIAIHRLALRAELAFQGFEVDRPRQGQAKRQREDALVDETAEEVSRTLDVSSMRRFADALRELADADRGWCARLGERLHRRHAIGARLAAQVAEMRPSAAARLLEDLDTANERMAATILYDDERVPRRDVLMAMHSRVSGAADGRGAVAILTSASAIDRKWGRLEDGFAHALAAKLGAGTLRELIGMHRGSRVAVDIVQAASDARAPVDVLRELADLSLEVIAEGIVATAATAWPARAALALGTAEHGLGEAFLDRLRNAPGVRAALRRRMTGPHSYSALMWSHRLSLALFPDLSTEFAQAKTRWVRRLVQARTFVELVETFEAIMHTLAAAGRPRPADEVAATLAEGSPGWSWQDQVRNASSATEVASALWRLRKVHRASAIEAIAPPDPASGEPDYLLRWITRDASSPQVVSSLLRIVAHVSRDRAEHLLEAFQVRHPEAWERFLVDARFVRNVRTRASVFNDLAAAGYVPPAPVRSAQLDQWVAGEDLERDGGVLGGLQKVGAVTDVFQVCCSWGAARTAAAAIDSKRVGRILEYGRADDLDNIQRLLGLLVVADRRLGSPRRAAMNARMLADVVARIDGLPRRMRTAAYARLVGTLAELDGFDIGAVITPARERVDWLVARKYVYHPHGHWHGTAWLSWHVARLGARVEVSVPSTPRSLAPLPPPARLFALAWLDGPGWIATEVDAAFAEIEAQSPSTPWPLAATLAAATELGRVEEILARDLPWDAIWQARPGHLTALVPALRANPALRRRVLSQPGFEPAVGRLRESVGNGNLAALLVLEELERTGAVPGGGEPMQAEAAARATRGSARRRQLERMARAREHRLATRRTAAE